MSSYYIDQTETLWRTSNERIGTRRNLQSVVSLLHDKCFCCWDTSDTTPYFFNFLNVICYRLFCYERTNTIVNKNDCLFITYTLTLCIFLCSAQSLVDRLLSRLSTWYNLHYLINLKLTELLLKERNPTFNTCYYDSIYVRMIIEQL